MILRETQNARMMILMNADSIFFLYETPGISRLGSMRKTFFFLSPTEDELVFLHLFLNDTFEVHVGELLLT